MTALILLLVVVGTSAGLLLAPVKTTWVRRFTGWMVLLGIVTVAHLSLTDVSPIHRMIGICCVLLAGMKGLVYAEWARTQKLGLQRYCVFAFFWFGMDPASFRRRRSGLTWRSDVAIGATFMIIGTLIAWLVWTMGWSQIFIMFLPMSLGFHFGALRVLKGALRTAGFPVRTLFPNLLETRGIGDFWSKRWNVGYSQMMQRLVGRPLAARLGESAGIMAVFVGSGLLHELAITLPVRSGYGLPTLYFTAHGLLTLVEKKLARPIGRIPALLTVVLPMGFLFPPDFQREVIEKCLGLFALTRA